MFLLAMVAAVFDRVLGNDRYRKRREGRISGFYCDNFGFDSICHDPVPSSGDLAQW
jgi:hypothetical protein